MEGIIGIDRAHAVRGATARLVKEFEGVIGAQTVESFLRNCYDDLEAHARIRTWLPVLAERFARERLLAPARVESHAARTPLALFLCGHNSGRSQMATGFVTAQGQGRVLAWSGGSRPQIEPNPMAVDVMREVGIDISDARPNPWTDEIVRAADVVVTMDCPEDVARHDGIRYEEWDVPHISELPLERVRVVRDDIEDRVRGLLATL